MGRAWCVITEEEIMDMLRRAATGEDPDILYAEFYANADIEEDDDA